MTYADSLGEAVKVLYESNYGGGIMLDNPYKYAEILRAEEEKVTAFIREAMPDNSGMETLLSPLDYHNAKAYMKAKFADIKDVKVMLSPDGNIAKNVIENAVNDGEMAGIPAPMVDAINVITTANANGEIAPRMIDVTFDKAMYQDALAVAKKHKAKSLIKYWISNIDIVNISTLLRCKRIDADEKFFLENFIDGGSINDYVLSPLLKESYETIADKLRYTDYGELVDIACLEAKDGRAIVKFEAEWDNYLLDIFKTDKADIFTIAPMAGFYIAKKIELKMVRMILTCIKNKANESEIKARLRGFYA